MAPPIRVLHVDDDPGSAAKAGSLLEREHDQLTAASVTSPSTALDRLATAEFDCLVAESDTPERSIELLETVCAEYPNVPTILCTGNGSEAVASRAISAGITEYVRKKPGTNQYDRLADRILDVVSQERSHQRVAGGDHQLQTPGEVSSDILWIVTSDWSELLHVSPAYEDLWGRSTTALAAEPTDFLNGVHPADRDHVRTAMARLSSGESVDIEFRVSPDEDDEKWVWVRGTPISDENGTVDRITGVTRDVTEREHGSRPRAGRTSTTQILTAIQEVFYLISPAGRLRRWNECVREVTGYTDAELADAQVVDLFPDEYHERVTAAIEEAVATGEATVEADVLTADGDRIPFEFTGSRLTGPDGDPTGVVGIGRDVTGQKRQEAELTQHAELVQALSTTFPDYTFVYSDEGEYLDVITGWGEGPDLYTPADLIGQTVDDMFEADVAEQIHAAIRETLATASQQTIEYTIETPGGTYWYEGNFAPLPDGFEGNPAVVLSARDITERKEREQELARQNERLEKFASVVSHDLRNPLNVAHGRVELADAESDSEHLDAAANAIDRSLALVDDLLTIAREGEHVRDTERVSLSEIVDECWSVVETGNAHLVVESEQFVWADWSRLQQLLENLIRNAVEHGGDDVTVTVGDLQGGFYVADDGPGIPEADSEDVFQAGYSTSSDGTGFGLDIVQEIATAHDWEIRVTDSETGGARFEITAVDVVV